MARNTKMVANNKMVEFINIIVIKLFGVQDYKDYNTDRTVKFVVTMSMDGLRKVSIIYLSVCISIYPSIHLSIYPSIHLSIYYILYPSRACIHNFIMRVSLCLCPHFFLFLSQRDSSLGKVTFLWKQLVIYLFIYLSKAELQTTIYQTVHILLYLSI